jgi:hypothetical protein
MYNEIEIIENCLLRGYTMMAPMDNAWTDSLYTSQGDSYAMNAIDNSAETIIGGDIFSSFLATNNTSDWAFAIKIDDVRTICRECDDRRGTPPNEIPFWINHRSDGTQKLYTEILNSGGTGVPVIVGQKFVSAFTYSIFEQ